MGWTASAKALRWDHTLPGAFKVTEGRPVGQRLVREKGPRTPGCPKGQGFGTDLRRAWSLGTFPQRTEPGVCEGAEEPVPGVLMFPVPKSKWGAFNSPYCHSQPETPSGSHQASPDSESQVDLFQLKWDAFRRYL